MTERNLNTLIARSRRLDVRADHTRTYVGELARWSRRETARAHRRWAYFGGLGVAAAAAAAVAFAVWLRVSSPAADVDQPIQLGDRVAIIADRGASYRVVATDLDHTEIAVDRGTVTARLFPGTRRHQLALRGGGLEARATGTVYSLSVDERGGSVSVREGKVLVIDRAGERTVAAGTSWPPGTQRVDATAATRLLAMPSLIPSAPAPASTAPSPPPAARPADAGVAAPTGPADGGSVASAPAEKRSLAERWRAARLYRAQAKFDDAMAECAAIADARDPTWSPIALVEAARIELGPRAAPERAIALVDRFEREWPRHALAPEARDLRCRALRQVGRGAECDPTDAGTH